MLALVLVFVAGAMALQAPLASAKQPEVLVVARQTRAGASEGLVAGLEKLGRSTTTTEAVPSDLSSYKAVWVLDLGDGPSGLSSAEEEALENYVKEGGRLYLTGENEFFEDTNRADENIARAVLKNGLVTTGGHKQFKALGKFNRSAKDEVTQSPHELGTFLAVAPGAISSVDALSGNHALAFDEETATGAVFDESDMRNEKGRLVIYMDINYLDPASEKTSIEENGPPINEKERLEVIENIEDFLENTPERDELPETKPPAGNVLVLTSEAPTNLQAGLDTTAVLRSLDYEVTLSVAPSIGLAKTRRAKLARARRSGLAKAQQNSTLGKLTEWKMPKLKHYSAVWMLAEGSPAAQGANRTALAHYVAKGGRLYLGGNHVTYPSHEADQDILNAVLTDKQVTVHDGIAGGSMRFAPQALDSATQLPTRLGEMPIHLTAEISGLAPRNVLATDGEVATAAAFDETDMTGRRGRLVVYPDDWTQAGPEPTTRNAFVEDVQDFLEGTSKRSPERSKEYVALGDSYAAGVGSYEYDFTTTGKDGCYQALHGFAQQIAAANNMTFSFQACKGAQIEDVWGKQIWAVGADTRAVTLTIGGNDVGFSGIIKTCMLPKIHFSIPGENGKPVRVEGCHGSLEGPSKTALEWLYNGRHAGKYTRPGGDSSSNDQYQPSLQQIYESILYQAPGAELVVNGYPLLLETGRAPGDYVSCDVAPPLPLSIRASDLPWMAQEGEELNNAIKASVEAARANTHRQIRFADPRPVFTTHGLCDTGNSWINTVAVEPETPMPHGKLELQNLLEPRVESFHPTKEGQNALFNLVEETAQEF